MHKYIHYIFILKPDFVNSYVKSNNKNKQIPRGKHYSSAIRLASNFYIHTCKQKKKHINTKYVYKKRKTIKVKMQKKQNNNNKQILSKYTSDFF